MNAEVTMEPNRRQPRVSIEGEVRSRHAGGKPYPTSIRNLSPGGCCIELPYHAKIGERLWVMLPGLEAIEAEVCWSDKYLSGCAFKKPLYPAVFDHLQGRMNG